MDLWGGDFCFVLKTISFCGYHFWSRLPWSERIFNHSCYFSGDFAAVEGSSSVTQTSVDSSDCPQRFQRRRTSRRDDDSIITNFAEFLSVLQQFLLQITIPRKYSVV